MNLLRTIKPVIGMCHLPPLPGAPRYSGGGLAAARDFLLRDAEALVQGGVDALMIENFGDAPFFPGAVPPATVAAISVMAADVRRRFDRPLGVNVLRNDGRAALAVAVAAGADFIRVNVLSGARVTDQGVITAIAHDLLRDRAAQHAESVHIFADVDVKESQPLGAPAPIEDEIDDVVHRGLADAVIVSGPNTGDAARVDLVRRAHLALCRMVDHESGARPALLLGSGVNRENLATYWPLADGFIVGTALKRDGRPHAPVDEQRVTSFMSQVRELRR